MVAETDRPNDVVITVEPARETLAQERRATCRSKERRIDSRRVALRGGGVAPRAVSEGSRIGRGLPGHPSALPLEARKRVCLPPGPGPLESRSPGARRPSGEWIPA